jgi:hypothetical protein
VPPFFFRKTQALLAVRCLGGAMAGRNYWLDLFTAVTWQEFLEAGGKVSGFESLGGALSRR